VKNAITKMNLEQLQEKLKTYPAKSKITINKTSEDEYEIKEVKAVRTTKTKTFVPPTLQEVIEYFDKEGYTADGAKKAFNYYNSADWCDSSGRKVVNWKQKMIANWFKDFNKKPVTVEEKKQIAQSNKRTFKDTETLRKFHSVYGYGNFSDKVDREFGIIDVKTQFMIKVGIVAISGNNLVNLPIDPLKKKDWLDLWDDYENRQNEV